MSKRLRGSYYVDGRRSLTLPSAGDDKLVDVGFRLGVDTHAERLLRGGTFNDSTQVVRVACRSWVDTPNRSNCLGFRLAKAET